MTREQAAKARSYVESIEAYAHFKRECQRLLPLMTQEQMILSLEHMDRWRSALPTEHSGGTGVDDCQRPRVADRSDSVLAMSLRNSRHKIVTEYIDPDNDKNNEKLYLVQISEKALKRIITLLDGTK